MKTRTPRLRECTLGRFFKVSLALLEGYDPHYPWRTEGVTCLCLHCGRKCPVTALGVGNNLRKKYQGWTSAQTTKRPTGFQLQDHDTPPLRILKHPATPVVHSVRIEKVLDSSGKKGRVDIVLDGERRSFPGQFSLSRLQEHYDYLDWVVTVLTTSRVEKAG